MLRLIDWQRDEKAKLCEHCGFLETKSAPRLEETTLSFDCALLGAVTDKTFGPPMNSAQICLRLASHEDVPFLLELRRQTMHPHLLASGLIPSLEEDMRRVLFRLDCAQIILLANQPVGLLKVSRDGKDWNLIQIQLAPSLHGQGVGAQLIKSVINEARHAGACLRLDVLKANPARRLYERLGFTTIAETAHLFEMRLK
jgi:ribosomal protein S18 acetylase RimI-like enzyme